MKMLETITDKRTSMLFPEKLLSTKTKNLTVCTSGQSRDIQDQEFNRFSSRSSSSSKAVRNSFTITVTQKNEKAIKEKRLLPSGFDGN